MKQLLMLLLVTATSYTQTNSSQRIFKSPDGTFMFRYPSSVVLCQPQYDKPTPDTDVSNEALEPRLVGWAPDSFRLSGEETAQAGENAWFQQLQSCWCHMRQEVIELGKLGPKSAGLRRTPCW
jgi:hypothetical protein